LRQRLDKELKDAIKAKAARRVSTLRLVLAALKDRDIAARTRSDGGPISDDEILQMLAGMIKQRRESIVMYEKGGRADLVRQEQEEIAIIEEFLPKQIDEAQVRAIAQALVGELGATGVKDMGRVMAAMKQRYAGQMDFAKAAQLIKSLLAP
jgi:uncharacterized protein